MVLRHEDIHPRTETVEEREQEPDTIPRKGVTIAATTLVGRYLGAGKPQEAWQSARSCVALAVVGLGVLGTGLVLGRHGLVAVCNRDAAVQLLGARLLLGVALFQVCQGLALVTAWPKKIWTYEYASTAAASADRQYLWSNDAGRVSARYS